MDIETRARKIFHDHLNVSLDKVTDSACIIEDLGADSLDMVELVMAFEEEFEIEISDADAEAIVTVRDAISYVEQRQA